MPQTSNPQPADLLRYLTGAGFTVSPALDLKAALADAITEWETATGWVPFQADAEDMTLAYDPPGDCGPSSSGWRGGGRSLSLGGGLVSLTSLSVDGDPKVRGTDFFLRPTNAPVQNRPFTRIEFICPVWGPAESIVITGRRGWPQMPDNAWNAILHYGALLCAPQLGLLISGGVVALKEGDVETRFAGGRVPGPLANEISQWGPKFRRTVTLLERKEIF